MKNNISTVNPWHGIDPGKEVPACVRCFIEIPKGSKGKYELDKESGILRLDRVLFQRAGTQGRAPQLIDAQVVHDAEQPGAQVAARAPLAHPCPGFLQRVLHQIVGGRALAHHRPRVTAQARQLGED